MNITDATIITYDDISKPEPDVKVDLGCRDLIDEAIKYAGDPPMVAEDQGSVDADGNSIGGVELDYADPDHFAFCQWIADMDEAIGTLVPVIESAPRLQLRNRETLGVMLHMVWRCYHAFNKVEARLDKEAKEREIEMAVAARLREIEMANAPDPFRDEEGGAGR